MGVLIEAKGLGRNFGEIQAVRGVSFSVQAGDVLGFLGQTALENQRR
jgi:ABC-type multidrug transport system ATPase subunit